MQYVCIHSDDTDNHCTPSLIRVMYLIYQRRLGLLTGMRRIENTQYIL